MQNAGPAYSYRPGTSAGPSCAGSPDFCFLCEFSGCNEHQVGDTNYTDEIRKLVVHLASEHKELPTIVTAVARAYEGGAQQFVQWESPTGAVINNPTWTRDSVTRHLIYSTEFPLFNQTIDKIYQALIVAEQSVVMNTETGGVHQEAKAGLLRTIGSYGDWLVKTERAKASGTSRRARKRRAESP